MKFKISSASLFGQLTTLSRVIASKNSLSVLDNFLFKLEGERLTITASDLDTTLITCLQVESAEGSGMVALSAKILLDTLKEFPDMPLEFFIKDESLEMSITSNTGGEYNFIGVNGNEYPKLPALSEEHFSVTMRTDVLVSGISRTIFATSNSELRRVMMGVFVEFTPEGTTFVASDSQKLIRIKDFSVKSENPCSFILPHKPANLIKSAFSKDMGDVEVSFDSKNAFFKMNNMVMVCRLIEGRYPNYASVIPTSNPFKVTIDRSSLYNTIKRVSVFANKATHLISLELTENMITISAQDIDFSISAVESIPCQYTGDPMVIAFKSEFVLEILGNIDGQDVTIDLAAPERPGLFMPFEQKENEDVLMMLMPLGNY